MTTATLALAAKDLRIEARARDTLAPMLAFSLTVTLLLSFALPPAPRLRAPLEVPLGTAPMADALAGGLWITVMFAGLIGFARTFEMEREEWAIESLLVAPLDRASLFLAKGLANLAYIVIVEAVLLPVFALFFGISLGPGWLALALVAALVDIGFVAAGTLFASAAARTRSRELLLPVLALPALVPAFIAGVELTSDLFLGAGMSEVTGRSWFVILCAFDVVFGIVGYLFFEFVID